jgi:two-component system, OmpR family, phosphate regulon sensor histidine kinase PhoR
MRRSLFLAFFWRIIIGLTPLAVVIALLGERRFGVGTTVALLAMAALLAVAAGGAITRTVHQELAPLQALAESVPNESPSIEDFELQHFSDFDGLAGAIAGASTKAQSALARVSESRLQLEALLDSMQDAVVAVDSAGRIQWTNQKMQRLIPGSSVSSAVRVGHALVQTIRDPEVLDCVKSALDERTVCERRTTTLLPGRIFEVNASPMPGGGAVAVLHDITRIEEVERTQRDFVANVSHELRTPLTSITGYVETLLDHEGSLSPQARDFLSTILKNATRMNRLTEDLLIMARVESRENEMVPRPVRADALVRDAVDAMRGLVQDAEAVLEIGEVTTAEVFADSDSVMQVLGNLIENGIKYGQSRNSAQSRVVVSAREIVEPGFDGEEPAGQGAVEFSVRDFGQGIASEHLTRIFERFYRVDKARSRESGGTGLGLAIARHVVESQGGTIRAESELNAGSNFVVTLPRP